MSSAWWAKKMGVDAPPARPDYTSSISNTVLRPVVPAVVAPSPSVAVTVDNFADASLSWRGGAGTRTESQPCPNCSSHLYFSRSNSGSSVAPRCYSCGYTPGRPMQGMPL